MEEYLIRLQSSYDSIAEEYVTRIYHELDGKPLDRQLLDRLADRVRDRGTVCDLGCGPGHVARYLRDRGASVMGVDLSARMVEQARRLNPDIPFQAGNILSLEAVSESWAGIAAFYSLIHIPRARMAAALRELWRVLKPEGLLLAAFHLGEEDMHLEEMWGRAVSMDFLFFQTRELEAYLQEAGFVIEEAIERAPYEGVEHPSRRAYLFARK
jgi:SAM-dependent methyltransferase